MSRTFVTLAEVLETRGGPLLEDEVWSLLLGTTESLVDVSYKGHNSMCSIISPSSLLLSGTGTLAFKNCALSDEACTFTAPEMLQGRASSTKDVMEKMLVYSLGMTLYWSVDYHLPQNQPVQLSDHLNSLLVSMCEDLAHRRVNLNSILESCESQHKASLLPPPNRVIRQLVEDVFHEAVDHGSELFVPLCGRSQMIRERVNESLLPKPWRHKPRSSPTPKYPPNIDRLPRGLRHMESSSSWLCQSPYIGAPSKGAPQPHSPSITCSDSSASLTERKAKALKNLMLSPSRPLSGYRLREVFPSYVIFTLFPISIFLHLIVYRMADEPHVDLELPGSIVSKKGRSCSSQREVNVVLPSGQSVLVRCDKKSRGRDVFDMVVAHVNLVEHFYFGLAFIDDDEYFFLDHEIKISKVAPDSRKKVVSTSFLVFLRVKFFVDDVSFILHRLTRHQYYLQLRKDILEDRLYCNEETCMFLAALALQAEFGDYMPELYGRNYYQPEQYVSKSCHGHANNTQMLPEEAETEFLKIAQQLPEYGMVFHRVGREKKPVVGELVLGVCATGILVYELKNHLSTVTRRFLWRETDTISANRRKLTIECGGPSSKKHSFVTENSKIAQYLLSLCSAQHKFHSEMTSRQLNYSIAQDENIEKYQSICRTRDSHMKRLSCSEVVLNSVEIPANLSQHESLRKLCDDITAKVEACLRQQSELREINRDLPEPCPLSEVKEQAWSTPEPIPRIISNASRQKQDCEGFSEAPSTTSSIRGGRLISLNKISLQGVTFTNAAAILQSSPDEVELIVSQPKCSLRDSKSSLPPSTRDSLRDSKTSLAPSTQSLMLERSFGSQTTLNGTEEALALSNMATSKHGKRLHNPVVRILDAQSCILQIDVCKPEEGWLGFALIGGCNGSVLRVKKICTGGVAQQDGRLRVGDILLEVNGIIVSGLSHSKVVDILRKVKGNVQLIICRDIIPRANTAPCTDGSFYMASCPRDNMAACPGSNMASCPGSGSNMASCLGSNMAPCTGSNMMTCQGVNMAISTGSNMASCSRSNMASCPGSHVTTCPEAHMGDKAELVSNTAACFLPDVQQEDLPPELTSDPVSYVEKDITPLSPPHLSPPHHPAHRLQALTEDMAGQESCNSTPSHPACCLSSKSVTNLLHEASDRNQISVTTLGEPITGRKNSQSDGWSSEDEDDGTFEANGQEMMSPSSGTGSG
eukprot:XP_014054029.1 PREDICTED: LOW QUALITY PROTEIN: FERM and PDZ domain-containing protein 2 [Salmo salar]